MQAPFGVALLPGDGIGPEVTAEAVKVLKAIEDISGPTFRFQSGLIGGCALDATAVPLPAETISLVIIPGRFCSVLWADRSGTPSARKCVLSKGFCSCGRGWGFMSTCARPRYWTL